MQSWEKTYEYLIRNDTVMVAPMFFECMECDYNTWSGKEITDHHREINHFYRMKVDLDSIEEWNPSKHPGIPRTILTTLPQTISQRIFKHKIEQVD